MKKLVILIILFFIFGIIFLGFIFFGKNNDTNPDVTPTPTTTQANGVLLQSSIPADNSTNVPVNQEVSFTFSDVVNEEDVEVLVGPSTGQAVLFRGKTIVIRPIPSWNAGTPYRITIQYKNLSRIPDGINFQTIGTEVETLPDTAPNPTEVKASEDLQRTASPDAYLSNYTPYDTQKFTVTSSFKSTPTGHMAFTVVTKGEVSLEVVKSEVRAWGLLHGLTDTQFKTLDISYQ